MPALDPCYSMGSRPIFGMPSRFHATRVRVSSTELEELDSGTMLSDIRISHVGSYLVERDSPGSVHKNDDFVLRDGVA